MCVELSVAYSTDVQHSHEDIKQVVLQPFSGRVMTPYVVEGLDLPDIIMYIVPKTSLCI